MMWYGVLGTKELVQKTYKNLEQRVQLEVKKDQLLQQIKASFDLALSPPPLSATAFPCPCRACRAWPSSTFPATPVGSTSGAAPRRIT